MRILFQGAGAVGIAGAALLGQRHETVVVSRGSVGRAQAAYPRRVGWFVDGSDSGRELGWNVVEVAATRRVTVTDWAGIEAAGGFRITPEGSLGGGAGAARSGAGTGTGHDGRTGAGAGVSVERARRGWPRLPRDRGRVPKFWDLVVLTTRPGDLDEAVASAIRAVAPRWIGMTSQVDGDLAVAKEIFPGAEVVVVSPAFLSERVDPSSAVETGREVRYWSPFGAPGFLVGGSGPAVRRLARALGSMVTPVPYEMLIASPAVFIPYVAELSVGGGDWARLLAHLGRPSRATTEAIGAVAGIPVPMVPAVARIVLETLDRVSPIPMREYAGRHFARHEGQTLAMLEGWIDRARKHPVLSELAGELRRRGADR